MAQLFRVLYSLILVIISPFWIAAMGLMGFLGLDSCGAQPPNEEWIERAFDLRLDGATVDEAWDTHGGFHGDGDTYIALSLTLRLEFQISEINAEYAEEIKGGPWYSISEYPEAYSSLAAEVVDYREESSGAMLLPEITNGYFCIIDNFDGKDEYMWIDADWRMGSYWNWTAAFYDADALKLYYYESDM
jgi:hypothetical protein